MTAWSGIDYPRNTQGEEVATRAIAGGATFIFLLKKVKYLKNGKS